MPVVERDLATPNPVQDMMTTQPDTGGPVDMGSVVDMPAVQVDMAPEADLAALDMPSPEEDMAEEPDMMVMNPGMTPVNRARVVFSGHSLTDASVPTVRRLAMEHGMDFESIYQSVPGSPISFRTLGNRDMPPNWEGYTFGTPGGLDLVQEFRNPTQLTPGDRYDTVIITDRHDLLGVVQWESTVPLLRHYHDRLRESTPDGKTYLYHSWLDIDKGEPQTWIDYEKNALVAWECVATKANLTLAEDGLPQHIKTVATGWALAHMVEEALAGNIPNLTGTPQEILDQIFSDNVHMAPSGQLFVGAFTHASVFGHDPSQTSIPAGIDPVMGRALLELARDLARDYHARPEQGVQQMSTCRTHIPATMCTPFWTYFSDRPEQVSACETYFGSESSSPFRWPHADRRIWPDP